MTQTQIERAEQRAKALGEAQRDETKLDAMLGDIFQSDGTSEAFVTMDGVLAEEDADAQLSVKDITAGTKAINIQGINCLYSSISVEKIFVLRFFNLLSLKIVLEIKVQTGDAKRKQPVALAAQIKINAF